MIRIQTGKITAAAAEMRSQSSEISRIRERIEVLSAQVRQQSYMDEALSALKTLKTQLAAVEAGYAQLQTALESVCRIAEETEKQVTARYESEEPAAKEFVVKRSAVNLNGNLQAIARIRWS